MTGKQIRINNKQYELLEKIAGETNRTLADLAADAVRLYVSMRELEKQGCSFYTESRETKEKTRLIILGLS